MEISFLVEKEANEHLEFNTQRSPLRAAAASARYIASVRTIATLFPARAMRPMRALGLLRASQMF